jgi:signal transduction histidine kinase
MKSVIWLALSCPVGFNVSAYTIAMQQGAAQSPVIEKIWLQGREVEADSLPALAEGFSLPFDKNFITIQFSCPDDPNNPAVQYAYKLVGYDQEWIFSGNQRRASYANLRPGSYLFEFQASKDGANWSMANPALSIEVTSPFWSYWWFPFIAMVFVVLLLFIVYKIRVNEAIDRVLALEKIRTKEIEDLRVMMARDFHDEMGNKLASIIVLVSTLELLLKDETDEIKQALKKIESDSKSLFSGTKTFIWSIDPKSDSLYEIFNYIIHFGTDLFENTPIKFLVKTVTDNSLTKIIMPVGVSRQIFFIFKEAMTNSLVHANASIIEFSFKVDASAATYNVTLFDNGIGLTAASQTSPRGLNNMKSRAGKINGRLSFSNNPDGGLNVTLTGIIPDTKGL